jgi:hypothetical protein
VSNSPKHVTVQDAGHVVAEATVTSDADQQAVHADLHVEAGHLPAGTRTQLVDAVLDQTPVKPGTQIDVTLPAGDSEILDRLHERVDDLQTRPAGGSCLATGTTRES